MGDCISHGGGISSNSRPVFQASGDGAGGVAPKETRDDVGAHGLWRRGNTALFDVCIVNLDAGS